jgi:hypothetical protein
MFGCPTLNRSLFATLAGSEAPTSGHIFRRQRWANNRSRSDM